MTVSQSRSLRRVGFTVIVLSNPLLYLGVGSVMVTVRNLFGAGINPQSLGFNTADPFIEAMTFVGIVGGLLIISSWFVARKPGVKQ